MASAVRYDFAISTATAQARPQHRPRGQGQHRPVAKVEISSRRLVPRLKLAPRRYSERCDIKPLRDPPSPRLVSGEVREATDARDVVEPCACKRCSCSIAPGEVRAKRTVWETSSRALCEGLE